MDEKNRKEKQVERHLEGARRVRSLEERKRIQEHSKRRRQGREAPVRVRRDWRDWNEEQDEPAFEKIRRADPTDLSRPEAPAAPTQDPASGLPRGEGGRAGLVLSITAGRVRVLVDGAELDAALARELARTQQTDVAVGDEVAVDTSEPDHPRVVSVAPRRSVLSRPDPGRPGRERVLAANVDAAVIVVAARRAPLRVGIVERMALALERGGVRPVACVNKIDLWDAPAQRAQAEQALAPLRATGVPVHFTSAESGEGIGELAAQVAGRTSVFLGHSGVGKSSLLNAIDPAGRRRIAEVREGDGKGRHTTTASSLLELAGGTRVIDTPGIRAFGMWGFTRRGLRDFFPELAEHASTCRFRDCLHEREPGCAVRAAAAGNAILDARHRTYLRILEGLEST